MQNLPFCTSLLLWGHTFPQRSLGQTEQSGERERRKKERERQREKDMSIKCNDTQT